MKLIHQALVFDSAAQFLDAAVPFVTEGVRRRDSVIAVTTGENEALLREQIGADAEQITFLTLSDWYDSPGRTLNAHHRRIDALSGTTGILRVLGEPVWNGLDPLETSEWGRYESVMNVALAGARAWIMCGYDSRSLPAAIVDDARRTHPALAVGARSEVSNAYADPASYHAERNGPLLDRPALGVERLHDFIEMAAVRKFVADHAVRLGLPPDRLDDFTLAVNEIATNAIRHGAGRGEVWLWATDHRVICEISDAGGGPRSEDLSNGFFGFLRTDPQAGRGHGLWIARQICDLLEMRTGESGTTVRLHMRRE
ncbi:sensor histidine kinase [Dactylosporangium matsuzakiense]|uniref:Anti-sigma regulatory factor n=1 Tax=Dactylosporangium matsuzakiense TaxID=53360 RepID=A0A9W6KV07_9ACTN|nr:sensor histidine kinase [Dactylosporangium matsuzakiense]UWZ44717.1 sensor histidine kinase [Dactylosporangium matsuzakiense]GLL05964.1 anti-sigma regulatory factor [Dactylosporangium matsuzakiense]